MDMKVRNQVFHDVQLTKGAPNRYPSVDHLTLEDEQGQEYHAAKRGLLNKEKGWAGRGDTVEIGGMKLKAVHNVGMCDTKTEKALRFADDCVWRVKLAGLWCVVQAGNLMMGILGLGNR